MAVVNFRYLHVMHVLSQSQRNYFIGPSRANGSANNRSGGAGGGAGSGGGNGGGGSGMPNGIGVTDIGTNSNGPPGLTDNEEKVPRMRYSRSKKFADAGAQPAQPSPGELARPAGDLGCVFCIGFIDRLCHVDTCQQRIKRVLQVTVAPICMVLICTHLLAADGKPAAKVPAAKQDLAKPAKAKAIDKGKGKAAEAANTEVKKLAQADKAATGPSGESLLGALHTPFTHQKDGILNCLSKFAR